MKKKFIALILGAIMLTTLTACSTSETKTLTVHFNGTDKEIPHYATLEAEYEATLAEKGIENYIIYDCSELTSEMLETRTSDTLIIERVIGVVTNANKEGDGKVLNLNGNDGWYIAYDEGYDEGTIVLSYFIYNGNTQYVDDITERADYVLCTEYVD